MGVYDPALAPLGSSFGIAGTRRVAAGRRRASVDGVVAGVGVVAVAVAA
jgi:hypothetical protein